MLEFISQLLLVAGASLAASLCYRSAQQHNEAEATHTHLLVISLSCVFIALSGLATLLLTSPDPDSQTLARMLDNLATFAGLPLICSALLALARGWQWSRAAWGRWLLVLFAMFELCRRSGVGDIYSEWLMVGISLCWLVAAAMVAAPARITVLLSALLASAALVLFSPFSILANSNPLYSTALNQNQTLYAATLAAALVLLASQSGRLVPRP